MKAALLLSGAGCFDGSEIAEATLALTMLEKYRMNYRIFSLNKEVNAVDHSTGSEDGDRRNAKKESARIARGPVEDITALNVDHFDLLVMPGGMGAIKVFSRGYELCKELLRVLEGFHEAKKEIVGICIVPLLLAQYFHKKNLKVSMTLGDDVQSLKKLSDLNMHAIEKKAFEYVYDQDQHIWTTSAFMNASNRCEVLIALDEIFRRISIIKNKSSECSICRIGDQPYSKKEANEKLLNSKLSEDWSFVPNSEILKLVKNVLFKDFRSALHYVNQISEIAESLGHHPNISFTWGEVEVQIYTHKIHGLHQNDFILASAISEIKV